MNKPEEEALCRLAASRSNLGEAKVEALRGVFVELRRIGSEVAAISPLHLYEAQWATLGIVGRSYQLMVCGVEQILRVIGMGSMLRRELYSKHSSRSAGLTRSRTDFLPWFDSRV